MDERIPGDSSSAGAAAAGPARERGAGFWPRALGAVIGPILANLAVWWVGVSFVGVPADFPPLAGPGPTIFFSAVGGVGAVVTYKLLGFVSSSPGSLFRGVALVVLLLSFVPDLWLLSAGGREAVPGATVPAVAILMTMHVVAAGIIVWSLTGASAAQGPGASSA